MSGENVENYLKSIYKLQSKSGKVPTSALAERLGISDPSVSDMVKKLSEQGMVRYAPYKGVELTENGRRIALKIVRRHRLWELFLVQMLNYSWDKIDAEAERLEHITSDGLERKLDEALGFPQIDPHGDPIPTVDGEISESDYISLADLHPGQSGIISRVSDSNPEILQYVAELGLALDKIVHVKKKMEFDGSLLIKIGSKEHFVSRKLAGSIFVQSS
ncbi:MAG: metal-dependent transcriptional regulator [Bacteroidota bacterium]